MCAYAQNHVVHLCHNMHINNLLAQARPLHALAYLYICTYRNVIRTSNFACDYNVCIHAYTCPA